MVNNISFSQLYNTQKTNYSPTDNALAPTSFGNMFSDALGGLNSDPISAGLSPALRSNSSGSSEFFLNLFKNAGSGGMLNLLFAMLGLNPQNGSQQGSVYGMLNGSVMQKISNGFTAPPGSNYGEAIPEAASKAVNPFVTSTAYNRSAELYRQVINQFHVETNPRYEVNKKGHGDTYCNIFLWDVTRAMGAEIPHYVDPQTKEPVYYPNVSGARELTANATYNWLAEKGAQYGWREVTAEQAQLLANQGRPVVTAKKNPSGHGHVQVVCPSADGAYDPRRGVTVAQAGSKLTNYSSMASLYRSGFSQFKYYAHI